MMNPYVPKTSLRAFVTSTFKDADLALLLAGAWDLPHLQTGCAPNLESEINIQSASAEERRRTRRKEFVLGIRPQAFEIRK